VKGQKSVGENLWSYQDGGAGSGEKMEPASLKGTLPGERISRSGTEKMRRALGEEK